MWQVPQGVLQVKIRRAKFVYDALREGQRLRAKTWGKKDRSPRADRRQNKQAIRQGDFE
jgi:hypothetical protein